MKKIKKLLILLLAAVLVFNMVACSNTSDKNSANVPNEAQDKANNEVKNEANNDKGWYSDHGIKGKIVFKEELGLITRFQIQTNNEIIIVDKLGKTSDKTNNIGDIVKLDFNQEAIVLIDKI